VKIGIIGSGISGLTAAYRLSGRNEVTVFEANDYAGGHTNTVRFELDGRPYAIDTGFIVFNERNYPEFTALLHDLNVETQPTSMSFSVRSDRTGLEYNGESLDKLFVQRSNLLRPSFYRMIHDILRFNREAPAERRPKSELETVDDYAARHGYSLQFIEHYLVPLGASLWSCPASTFRRFPIQFVVDFLANHGMLQLGGRPQWKVIRGGSYRYVEPLTRPFRDRIRLNTPVQAVERRADHVRVVDSHGAAASFDHVIFACHSDQAIRILQDPTRTEAELLAAFPYQRNEAFLHTDASVLPRRKAAWASWNYRIRRDDPDSVAVTYNMNILQGLTAPHVFNVTLNDDGGIREESILRRILYEHPIFTAQRTHAQRRRAELVNANRTSFCGAYWGYGFHEDGVRSALDVVESIEQRREAAA
jgi:predicted NAD/FAD-binding protein